MAGTQTEKPGSVTTEEGRHWAESKTHTPLNAIQYYINYIIVY